MEREGLSWREWILRKLFEAFCSQANRRAVLAAQMLGKTQGSMHGRRGCSRRTCSSICLGPWFWQYLLGLVLC